MGQKSLYETSVRNCNYSLRNNPEELSSQADSCSDIHQMSRFSWNVIHHVSSLDNQIGRTVRLLLVYS